MPLDAQAEAWLKDVAESGLQPLNEMTVDEARAAYAAVVTDCGLRAEPLADVSDHTIAGSEGNIPVRIYTPEGSGPFPMLVYFHGGGWVLGGLEAVHGVCTALANRAHAMVLSVDYRLAPEHPFPAAVNDCYAATKWAADNAPLINGDAERIAVAGDDAGGGLAAVISLLAREGGSPSLMFQLLLYPITNVNFATSSYEKYGQGYFLTINLMKWFQRHYLTSERAGHDWRASPMRAPDLSGLPPAHVITAELDPLRDEAEAYAARLRSSGVETTVKRYDGQIHAFATTLAGVIDEGRLVIGEVGMRLRQVFRAGWQPRLWL
jgi:acetyl esterase